MCDKDQSSKSFFVAGAVFGGLGVSLFVAGAAFRETLGDIAEARNVLYSIQNARFQDGTTKVSETAGAR